MRQQDAKQQCFNFDNSQPEDNSGKQYKKKTFASDEEKYFSWYLDELERAGYAKQTMYEPYTYRLSPIAKYNVLEQLKTKVKTKRLKLFAPHEYTPDFGIIWNHKAKGVFYNHIDEGIDLRNIPFIANNDKGIPYSIIEIKPGFDKYNMIRLFRINQKWLFFQGGVYVQEVVVDKKNGRGLFPETFTPEKYLLCDKAARKRTLYFIPQSLREYVQTIK